MKSVALELLRLYKRWISPAFPPSCRYVPTCSEYAAEAVERYGVVRGGAMAAWRLLRCHPLATGGLDPVVKDAVGNPTHSRDANEWGTHDALMLNAVELRSAGQPRAAVPTCNS
ncbi:MAG: membrane protein insertion efficiency factor YidD [Terriglobales bacterium]